MKLDSIPIAPQAHTYPAAHSQDIHLDLHDIRSIPLLEFYVD